MRKCFQQQLQIGARFQMGSNCCSPVLDNYEIKLDKQKIYSTQQQMRKGYPSSQIAVKLSQISQKITPLSKIQQINKKVFKVVEYERKFKGPLRVNKQPLIQNRLVQPYYIPSLEMFYVGQWVFDPLQNDNVPGGIGRLYQDGAISEGIFKTFMLNSEQIQLIKQQQLKQEKQNISEYQLRKSLKKLQLSQNREKSELSGSKISIKDNKNWSPITQFSLIQDNKIDRLLKADRQKMISDVKFVIKLHGAGRINSREEGSEEEVEIEGEFYYGILNGRGTLRVQLNGEQTYCYVGLWKNGQKHGKGTEKVKGSPNKNQFFRKGASLLNTRKIMQQSFRYEGNFFENYKHGKGDLTFIGSAKDQHNVQKDIQKMQKKMAIEGQNMKLEAYKKAAIRQHKQSFVQQKLNTKNEVYPASKIILIKQMSLIFDMHFVMERMYRTVFSQNYSGEFKYGKMDGQGTYVWSNGKIYKGKWKDNVMNGRGEFYWPDGSYFQGNYQNDERNGEGIMIWSVLKRYRGSWAYGLRHGYGQSIQIDQATQKMTIIGSIWKKDEPIKRIFQQVIDIAGFNNTEAIQRQVQDQFMGGAQKRRNKNKSKNKNANDQPQVDVVNFESLKNIAEQTIKSHLQRSISKFRSD